jgi:hypothetical protein
MMQLTPLVELAASKAGFRGHRFEDPPSARMSAYGFVADHLDAPVVPGPVILEARNLVRLTAGLEAAPEGERVHCVLP